jgi:hypothetical protein
MKLAATATVICSADARELSDKLKIRELFKQAEHRSCFTFIKPY